MEAARAEEAQFKTEVEETRKWMSSERFKYTVRPYTAEQVVAQRSPITLEAPSNPIALKFYDMCRDYFNNKKYVHTGGLLDPVQVVQAAKYLRVAYVSGWQSSSTASTSNEPGPDFADYPADTLPNKCDQLFKALQFHSRRQRNERSQMTLEEKSKTKPVDFEMPIIVDGDTGFGGITSIAKLIKMMIEAGASAVHLEDQMTGAKKCGHLGGKVLVPISTHFDRMAAARLQADIMKHNLVLISRTDADSAAFLSNDIDPRDHPFIAGSTNPDIGACNDAPDQEKWLEQANLMRYSDCIAAAMKKAGKDQGAIDKWMRESMKMSNADAKKLAKSFGFGDVFWCKYAPRTVEGYFHVIGGMDYAVVRGIAYSEVSDLLWAETSTPNVKEISEFAHGVHAVVPHQMLSYNLSPSFNWDLAGSLDDIKNFQTELGKLGICYHFCTLFGFHTNALAIDQVAKAYAGPDGIAAYVQMVQQEERRLGVETLTHQKWSGTGLMDHFLTSASKNASTSASKGATEDQFKKSKL